MENKKLYTLKTFDGFEYVFIIVFFSIMAYIVHPKINFIWPTSLCIILLGLITIFEVKTYFELYENYVVFKKPFCQDIQVNYGDIKYILLYSKRRKGKTAVKFYYHDFKSARIKKKKFIYPKKIMEGEFVDILKQKRVRVLYFTGFFSEPEEN